jgi:hypothetical protein
MCSFYTQTSSAAVPNAEGLFRNPNNQDLAGNFVKVDLLLEELPSSTVSENQEEEKPLRSKKKFMKYIFSIDKDRKVKVIQIEYVGEKMRDWEIRNMSYFPNIFSNLQKDSNYSRVSFYSQLMMFSLNDSRGMSIFLKKINSDYELNYRIMNKEKVRLFKKYKNYLVKINKNKDLKKKLISPFHPIDDEKGLKLKEILSSRTYKETEKVNLIRRGGKFYWSLGLDKANALFENKTHRIKSFSIDTGRGHLEYEFGQFISLDGVHELPQNIYFRGLDGKKYRISFLSYKNFASKLKKRRIGRRYKNWRKRWKNAKEKKVNRDLMTTTDVGLISPYNERKIFLY